ncbi:MAG: 50S ribosomal protein L6 [Lentisphaerae bacterium RIFOXYB12_FULL_65_16]|nr:MAG: 50S ribosomal protein L6 [Lentisphaerae bacterium RIFOXYA12_64_32]OGV90149.1 MAG: 50S ribosomal protein L6 [Lentisphaerae bacterium RIFOXYB12_FULL_65_16]
MSRIGKKPVVLADKVKVEVDGSTVTVQGPKGSLSYQMAPGLEVRVEAKNLFVENVADAKTLNAVHGLTRSLINNMVVGVTVGYREQLEVQGVGYRGQCKGRHLTLSVGYSSPVEYDVPEGVILTMPNQTTIVVEGIDKHLVGEAAATIRRFRPPDAYKGKGVRYAGEQVTLKEGKTVS